MKTTLRSFSRPFRGALFAITAFLGACSGPAPATPQAPPPRAFADAFKAAFEAEAQRSDAAASYLDLIDLAVAHPEAPGAFEATIAALDALVFSDASGLEALSPSAVAFRSREAMPLVAARLGAAWDAADPTSHPGAATLPIMRGLIANALHEIALFTGDIDAASAWSKRRACAQTATVIGPLDWTPLRGLDDASPIDPSSPLEKTYPGVAPFAAEATPEPVHADQCQLDINATSVLQGVRAAVVDLYVPRPQTIYVALSSSSAAVVDVGGVRAIRRGFEAGGKAITRFAAVKVPAGTVRVVVRVAQKSDSSSVELNAWDDQGQPLRTHAPRPGEPARARAFGAAPIEIGVPARPEGEPLAATLAAAALLGLGDARAAEHLLEPRGDAPAQKRPLALEVLYARAIEAAEDLPDSKMVERMRGAIDRVLEGWPEAWEARIGHARATERRRGLGEGVTEALRELGARAIVGVGVGVGAGEGAAEGDASEGKARDPLVVAYAALLARRSQLLDISEQGYAEVARRAPGAPLVAALDARLHDRKGADAVAAACRGGMSRASTDCLDELRARGDAKAALAELERLRKLRGDPGALREVEIDIKTQAGDLAGALAAYDALEPAERRLLDALGFAAGRGDVREVRRRFGRDRAVARDAPYGINALVRAANLLPDPAPRLEAEGRRIVLADQKSNFLPGAATAVLRHIERYSIDEGGLVYFVTHDVRRVSGTTDVAMGGMMYGPMIEGRAAPRLLRRRIHKRDGRVLEPDAAANSAQVSDLSQLEQGDYIEQIIEGWALPGDTGQLVIDTPDLLPERTSVREARIELRRGASVPFTIWAHPMLGKPAERNEGKTRVSVWQLKDAAPRRIEDGIPRMERGVSLSFGTQSWANVARAIEENILSLDDRDPFVSRWAREAAGDDKTPSRALVERVVAAAGKKIKVASGGELSDVAAIFSGGSQRSTARTMLELGQGSRAWVIYRALRELGVKVDLAIAEPEPFSASPDFPAHAGRFRHPLVVARLPEGDVWIDADVEGPPLPPGRVSPELRGRVAMLANGKIVPVEGTSGDLGDEVDLRLSLDEKGDAKGTFTVLLHGRTAQTLAEAFETIVGSDRREMLRGVVLAWVPWADVEDVTVSSSEGSWEVALRASISVQGYGRPEGKGGKTWVLGGLEPVHMAFSRAGVGTLGATYASRGARQNALSIESPIQYHVHRRVELPAGAKVARLPDAVAIDGKNLQASRKTKVTGSALEDDFTLSLPTGTVAAEEYQAFFSKVQAVDDGFMAGTRVQVKP